jgi:SAM-dependent methyltransferase
MEKNFARLGIGAKIVSATGESLDKLAGPYDVIVFYSSLHHCDDVLKALQNSFALLRPGGKVFLFEPVLKFYRSKAWFYRELELHPENVGHYGGNEHIYRYGEYVNYLEQAGFKNLRAVPSAAYARVPKRAPWDSVARYAIKRIYFWLVRNILMQIPLVPRLLMQLSLINPVLVAEKV